MVVGLGNFWYFGKLLRRGGNLQEVVATGSLVIALS